MPVNPFGGQLDGTSVTNVYLLTGEVGQTSGSRTYPVGYSFDYAGRMKTMTNWTTFPSTGARVTTWNYDAYRGFLSSKTYDGGAAGPSYTYTPAGRLKTRVWARNITTTYNYNAPGSLTNVNYSDSTPGVTNTYDRLGRLSSVFCNGMTGTMAYNLANELLSETYSGGTLGGLSVTNGYDQYLRRTNLTALASGVLNRATYAYDNASRLSSVSDGTNNATYSYLANSPLVSQITFKQSSTTRMTTAKTYDYLNRVKQISSAPSASGQSVIEFNYSYNDANQRTTALLGDGSYWVYTYDKLGQVTGGKKYWSDGTRVAGQQFEYTDDDIGNQTQTKAGGDQSGANLRTANYTNNSLNQITSRDVFATNDVVGLATSGNSVTVNGNTAYRRGEYFWQAVGTNNSSAPSWFGVTVNSGGNSVTGNVLFPKTAETFTYDADGNLTSDGLWTNTWNAENRMIVAENLSTVPSAARAREEWTYLPDGRWSQRIVSTNNGTAYYPAYTNRFVWDGQVLLAVLDHTNGFVMSFMRGLDLSGTMQGAGGVGGLLAVSFKTNGTHFVAYDGNGNVTALVSASDGTETAHYDYTPFGEPLRITGVVGKLNPIRYSTQFADDVTGDLKYLYRDYTPSTATWKSRDPIGEWGGGSNLYGFVREDPINFVDLLGFQDKSPIPNPVIPPNWPAPGPGQPPLPLPNIPPGAQAVGGPGTTTQPPPPPPGTPPGGVSAPPAGLLLALNTCSRWFDKKIVQQAIDGAFKACQAQMASRASGKKCCAVSWCYQCGCFTGSLNKLERVGLGLHDMSCADLNAKPGLRAGCSDKNDTSLATYDDMEKR